MRLRGGSCKSLRQEKKDGGWRWREIYVAEPGEENIVETVRAGIEGYGRT